MHGANVPKRTADQTRNGRIYIMRIGRSRSSLLVTGVALAALSLPAVAQQQQKPNILVIMADDIGYWNISAYNRGMMGYRTPNIDRIANEGAIFAVISVRA